MSTITRWSFAPARGSMVKNRDGEWMRAADVADAVDRMSAGMSEAQEECARLRDELDNKWAAGVHSFHAKCQRIECVLRRERDEARAENERLRAEAAREFERSARLGGQLDESQVRATRLEVALQGAADFLVKKGFASEAEYFLAHAALDQEGGNG